MHLGTGGEEVSLNPELLLLEQRREDAWGPVLDRVLSPVALAGC